MSETTASDAPEEVEKVKPAQTEKGVCKHWAQKGFCFYGADNECKFLHPVKEAPRVAAILELENKGEDQTELLKAVKDVMTSADRGADVDAPRPDFSDHDIELLAASELALMQRNFHVGTGEGKIRDYTWRFGALDEHTAKGFVASIGKVKDLAKTLGCRPIKNKAHAAIADIVIDALMRVSKKKLTEKKPKALLDICYRAKGNGAPGKLVLKGVKHPK